MRSDSSTHGAGRLISRSRAATTRTAGVLRVLFTLLLLAAVGTPLMAAEAGGEANLKLPWLNDAPLFLGGIPGRTLLMGGLVVSAFGLLFGLVIFTRLRKMPVHACMLEVSELIYETCKTYLASLVALGASRLGRLWPLVLLVAISILVNLWGTTWGVILAW